MSAPTPSLAEATRTFARIGLQSFGGPAGQIALMHRVLVEEKRWLDEQRFLHALNYCMLLPGPEAMQLATYAGWLLHGVRGGLIAGVMFVLPGALLIIALSALYALNRDASWIGALFFGLKAAVLAIIVEALIRVARRALKSRRHYALAALAFLALFAFQVPFPLVVLAAGLYGLTQPDPSVQTVDAVPSDGTPWRDALHTLAIWGTLWALPVIAAAGVFGPAHVLVTLGVFFAKMAMVTFGGAYAVLSYVAQAAVADFHWLAPGEMLDGLAMAETTPGPLILVLVFVGFLAGFRAPAPLDPLSMAIAGALMTLWVTFIPCFMWIFLGAPHIEALRGNRRLAAALAAVTAAVVGVIVNLAAWFFIHALFKAVQPFALGPLAFAWPVFTSLDWRMALLGALAALCLLRLHLGMAATLALSAAGGFLLSNLH